MAGAWSFRCSACGKCCNSAPAMSVPELLHHQARFVGCLAIRRMQRLEGRDRLAEAVLHPLPGGAGDVLLATHAFGPSGPCPALGSDLRCTIHDDRKPAACAVVPLDALVPDELQPRVLAERRAEASYMGADCIVPGERPGAAIVTRGLAVVDAPSAAALARRRADLAEEKRRWGSSVFALLQAELFATPAALARVPADGFLLVAIAPVLVVLAAVSDRCRRRCVEYLDAQGALIDRLSRAGAAHDPLGAFARANRTLRTALASAAVRPASSARDAAAIEAWMGLPQPA